ncbi:Fic family protein [bacterium]|nr:Fic family protein [Candidatus Elulimicrobium humile]
MEKFFEYDHHPEIVENNKGLRRLEKLNVKEDLISPESRKDFFLNLTDEQYKKMFCYINSITRGERINYEYEDGILPSLSTPSIEDKERLMNSAFQTVRDILNQSNQENITEEELRYILRRAGLTMAGAINYIHPKSNGNGRTARILQYIIEYGIDRGSKLFEEELYSIISKQPIYEGDELLAIETNPPEELNSAISEYNFQNHPQYGDLNSREQASLNVDVFLSMMKGEITVPVNKDYKITRLPYIGYIKKDIEGRGKRVLLSGNIVETIPKGTINGDELYEQSYVAYSTVPNRKPSDIPQDLNKNTLSRKERLSVINTLSVPGDLV